jgi:Tfp pilus assembly protein PilF
VPLALPATKPAPNPEAAASLFRLALRNQARNRDLEAARNYARALQLRPNFYEAAFNLGVLLQKMGQLESAAECYRRAVQLRPNHVAAWSNLGVALRDAGRIAEAIESLRQALRLRPDSSSVLNNLGNALRSALRYEEAIAAFRQALVHDPGNAGIYENLGNALRETGRVNDAVSALRQALRLRPDFAEAHWDLAFALLMQGDFARGFEEHEWRWRLADFPSRNFPAPLWEGQDLAGRTLLVHAEQGAGDAIQFVRLVSLLAARGAQVVLECARSLAPLFASVPGVAAVVCKGDPLPPFDFYVPLLSLPHRLGLTLESIPAHTSYLRPPPERPAPPLPPARPGAGPFKAGLAWQGNPRHKNDRQRSLAPELLEPLLGVSGVAFYGLQIPLAQTSPRLKIASEKHCNNNLISLSELIHDYADTALFINQLDLIITVDTSVAHLAGALGRPVWVLLPYAPCWRWLLDRRDSPWYPSMRLFRQSSPGNWPDLIREVGAALAGHVQQMLSGAKVPASSADN